MMVGGEVSVSEDGTIKKSGLAGRIFDHMKVRRGQELQALEASYEAQINQVKADPEASAVFKTSMAEALEEQKNKARVGLLRSWAREADALGVPIVAYLQEQARVSLSGVVATITTSTSAGVLPDPAAPGAALDPPASPVALPVTGEAGAVELPIL